MDSMIHRLTISAQAAVTVSALAVAVANSLLRFEAAPLTAPGTGSGTVWLTLVAIGNLEAACIVGK